MKKLSYLFLLLVGIWLAGCDDSSEASLIPEIIPTEQGSDTYVMKGYESSDNGFNVYKPKAIGTPFYIQSKAFTGRNYAFAPVNSEALEGLTVVPSADAFSESVEVTLRAIGCVSTATIIIRWASSASPIFTVMKWA